MDLFLKRRAIVPDIIWHSPLLRAKETAQVIAEDFSVPLGESYFREQPFLAETFIEDSILDELSELQKCKYLFMVGHGPSLMRLATFFVGTPCLSRQPSTSGAIILYFSGAVREGEGRLLHNYVPEEVLPELLL